MDSIEGVSLASSAVSAIFSLISLVSATVSAIFSLASSLVSTNSSLASSVASAIFSSASSLASSIFLMKSAVSFSAFSTISSFSSILADSLISSMVSAGLIDLTTLTALSVSSTINLLASFSMNSFCFSVIGTWRGLGCASFALALAIVAVCSGLIGSWNTLTSSSSSILVLTLSGVLLIFLVGTCFLGTTSA